MEAGLVDVTCEPFAVAFTGLATTDRLLWLERTAHQGVEDGVLTGSEVEEWWAELEASDREGRFFGGGIAFVASGRKL
ncbi:MAG: hypothetical protein JO023_17590 [Chloroflexi bacterium]|nr:hypothetical protein [Chloroflexota bacterium]